MAYKVFPTTVNLRQLALPQSVRPYQVRLCNMDHPTFTGHNASHTALPLWEDKSPKTKKNNL